MKKMSDVWGEMHLPSSFATIDSFIMNGVEYSSGDYKALIFGNDEPADATIKAIHMHDELVEMLQLATELAEINYKDECAVYLENGSATTEHDLILKFKSLLERHK